MCKQITTMFIKADFTNSFRCEAGWKLFGYENKFVLDDLCFTELVTKRCEKYLQE